MVAYQPPEKVLFLIGASFPAEPILLCAVRLKALAEQDEKALMALCFEKAPAQVLQTELQDVRFYAKDKQLAKHDTPLPMAKVVETMAKARAWMREIRELALLNLSLDQPSVMRIYSPSPEIEDGYPRDLLEDLELRVKAASDLLVRLDDCGVTEKLVNDGKKLAMQLRTAIGEHDLKLGEVPFKRRKFYMKKAGLYILCKRVARAGRIVHRGDERRAALYHTREVDQPPSSGSSSAGAPLTLPMRR